MLNIIQIPQINPIKFYWQSDVMNEAVNPYFVYNSFQPNQNERGFDNDFFYRNQRSWVDKVKYFQPWQQGDKIVLQFYGAGLTTAFSFYLIDEKGNIVKSALATVGSEIGVGSGIYIREVEMLLYDIPEGKYMPQILREPPSPVTEGRYAFAGEPIEVKVNHENTMLFKYKHSENAYGIFWETGIEMWQRIHAAFTKLTPDSQFNVYDDDTFNATLLSGVKYRNWQLSIGVGSKPVPIYRFDNLEEVFLCDSLFIDHKYFTRTEDSKLEQVPIEKNPLFTGNIALREKINEADLVVDFYPALVLGPAPRSKWFAIKELTQTTPGTIYPIGLDFSGAKNFVDYLNSSNIIGTVDYINTFFVVDSQDRIVLMTTDAAVYAAYEPGLVFTDLLEGHLHVEVETAGAEVDLVVQFVNGSSSKYWYFWGDGTEVNGSSAGVTQTKTFAAGKKFKARLYWDQVEEIYLDASHQIIQSFEGELPYRLQILNCENNLLKTIKNNLFGRMGGFGTTNFQLSGNRLTQYTIEDLIKNAFDEIDQFSNPGSIDVQSQVPLAGPSIELYKLLSKLSQEGLTILHD